MTKRAALRSTFRSGVLPALLLVALWGAFCAASPQFGTPDNVARILAHASSNAITAIGMTFVLIAAGIDLSVGAVMLLAAAIGGQWLLGGGTTLVAAATMVVVGASWGAIAGTLITRLRMTPFIVTLALLFVGRGAGLWITRTRPMALPDEFRVIGAETIAGIPIPIGIMLIAVVLAHGVLTRTPFGRQLYAIGENARSAREAGIDVTRNIVLAHTICGAFAALGGVITLSQLNAVSPSLGEGRELTAIAAAVLGGVSLFGGRGGALGAVLGAVFLQTIYSGLNALDADPSFDLEISEYAYPLVTSAIIFAAVMTDSMRTAWLDRGRRPLIRPGEVRS
ncbi:MAG: ABC transporter permease [Pirellulales bacterium]|nr:ABC transporter permease [Pirellulales bacterium]